MNEELKDYLEKEGNRLPSGDEYSDFEQAKGVSKGITWENTDIKHLHACKFGENDGPDWIWIIEFKDGTFGWLKAGCDYTGWDCQASGKFSGGYVSAKEAIENLPDEYDCTEADKALLLLQSMGEKPYALS